MLASPAEATMTDEFDRLQDLNIEEAVGRSTPPDLTDRILAAADKRELDEAVTPISGRHAVPRTHRPTGRRMTGAVAKKNWQGAGIVTAFALLFTFGLVAFVLLKDPTETPQQDTAETPQTSEPSKTEQQTNHSPPRKRWSPASNEEQPKEPGPNNQPEPNNKPEPEPKKPDDVVEQPTPEPEPKEPVEEPEPKDTVEEPQPEPEQPREPVEPKPEQPKDSVEEPNDEGKTTATPARESVVVASFPAASRRNDRDYPYAVRNAAGAWESESLFVAKNDGRERISLNEATDLRLRNAPINLIGGGTLYGDCVLSIDKFEESLAINLIEDEFWVDSTGTSSGLSVRYNGLVASWTGAAAVFEADGRKLQIRCAVGEIRCGEEFVRAGEQANLSDKGLSGLRPWDGRHKLRDAAPPHTLHHVGFEEEPANGLIEGKRIPLQASGTDGWVGYQSGRDAKVSLQFDETVELHPGTQVVIRLKQRGAQKLILQFWNAEAADNFGIDHPPGKDDEWQTISLPIKRFKDRESGRIVARAGDQWMSGGVYLTGENTDLYVDYIRIERKP